MHGIMRDQPWSLFLFRGGFGAGSFFGFGSVSGLGVGGLESNTPVKYATRSPTALRCRHSPMTIQIFAFRFSPSVISPRRFRGVVGSDVELGCGSVNAWGLTPQPNSSAGSA